MSKPWEDFQTNAATVESGPWDDFAPAVGFDDRIRQGKTWINSDEKPETDGMFPESPTGNEQGLTEYNALSLPLAAVGKAVAGVANPIYNLLTGHDPKAKTMVFDTRIGAGEPTVQEVGPRFQEGQTVFRDPNWVNPLQDDNAVNRGLNALWQGMTTPEGLATAGAGGVGTVAKAGNLPRLAQALNVGAKVGGASFISDMLAHAPETTAQAAGKTGTYVGTPEDQRTKEMSDQMKDALVQEAFNKFFLGSAGVHGYGAAKQGYAGWKARQPIDPEVVGAEPNNFSREIKGMLEAPKESVIDLENVGGVYRAPSDVAKQIEGPKRQFVTDEMGVTSPRANYPWMEGQDALAHRQPLQGYRPAPPVIETPEVQIQNTLKSIEAKLHEFVQAQKPEPTIVPAWQASGQAKQGGQISFDASAEAGAVPSARQSGVPDIRGGATEELKGMGDDAASLLAREKMIKPEGQSSGVGLKAPQIEDGKSIAEQLGIRYDGRQEMIPGQPKEVYTSQNPDNPFTLYVEPGTGMAEVKAKLEEKQKVHLERLNEKPLNPGGSEASLTPELQNKSKENNSLAAFAKSNGVEYVEGDTGPTILKKIQEKKSSKSTVESDKLPPENFTHILGNIQQKVKFAEGLGDITKAQADAFRARGDAIFEQSHSDPAGAREQAKKLNDEVKGSKKDPRTGGELYGGLFFLDPQFWKKNFGKNSHVAHDSKQLYNLLRNKMNEKSQAWKELDVAEFREFMKEGGKRTPSEVEAWVKKHAQGVRQKEEEGIEKWWEEDVRGTHGAEVVSYGMEGKVSEAKREYDKMTHEMETSEPALLTLAAMRGRGDTWQEIADEYSQSKGRGQVAMSAGRLILGDKAAEVKAKVDQYNNLKTRVAADEASSNTPRATSHYSSVSPFPTTEPMPEWTVSKSGKNVQRVDVVIPPKPGYQSKAEQMSGDNWKTKEQTGMLWTQDNLHENLPNTLGWAMIQYKTGPKGEKIAVVAEAQSRWGQSVREAKEANKAYANPTPEQRARMERHGMVGHEVKYTDHPLLKDYNRLILKAAIEQARKEGATHIVVSDAETAMMTERHDTNLQRPTETVVSTKEEAQRILGNREGEILPEADGNGWVVNVGKVERPNQEPGMRFNYDTALPRIAEELTGSKGEKVSLGEHKNALRKQPDSGLELGGYRKDLIFKNPDGTPKTDVSGMMYKITKEPQVVESTSQPKGGIGSGLQRAVEKNKEAGGIPNPFRKVNRPIKSSEFQDVQKFKPYANEVFDSTQPHGVGRIPGLSRLFDPRAYRTTPDGEAIIANAVASQKGQNFAALWQERQRDVQRVFETTDGTFKDANGRPAYMSDMIEAEMRSPGSQPLTAGQKTFIKEWKDLRKQIVDMATSEGVQFFVDEHGNVVPINENYFPRQAVGKVGIEETIKENVRKSVGGKQSFMKGRQYETEAEGVKAGIKYEPDEFARIGRWMASVYKAIADTRLAKDPLMQGRKQGRPKFLEEGQVFQPAFAGRIFPKDVAARLNRYYGEQPYNWLRAVSSVNDNLKALQFTLDVSAPFNQGLPLMGVNPARWAKATALSWKSLLDDRTMTKYLKDPVNAKAAKTILENNGSLVRLQDFLSGAGEGRALHNIAPIRASGRSMGTFLTVAKIEMFKAFEPIADAKGWSKTELVEAVENAVLSGKMEMLGLSQGRAMGERLLANAPSYIRGAINLTAMTVQGKISSRVAISAIVGMATAISAIMYGLYKASDLSDDEIEKRFDPRNPNFYRYPHLLGNGQRQEISFGNIMISLARLAGTSVDTLTGKKDYGPGTKGDPWLRWLSYRKSPVAGLALTMYTGEDYRGEPIGKVEAALRSLMPVSMEPMFDKAQESEKKVLGVTESKATGVGSQLFGLNTFNESKGAFRARQQEAIAQREYGKAFKDLDSIDRTFVVEEAKTLTDKTIDTKTTPRQVMNIVTDTEKRRTGLTKSLSAENQDWLKKHRLEVTSYQETMSINKRELKLADDEEKELLKKFMSEETEEAITTLRENGGEPEQERVNKRLELAHKRAWRKLRDAIGK